MAMTAQRQDGEPVSDINTTPLIDVMLVLLIMFIVTLPVQNHAVTIDTPRQTPPPPEPVEPLAPVRIAVDFDGALYWNTEAVSLADMSDRFAVESRRAPQPEIHIVPHQAASYGYVAAVMASAQREGLTKLGVVDGS